MSSERCGGGGTSQVSTAPARAWDGRVQGTVRRCQHHRSRSRQVQHAAHVARTGCRLLNPNHRAPHHTSSRCRLRRLRRQCSLSALYPRVTNDGSCFWALLAVGSNGVARQRRLAAGGRTAIGGLCGHCGAAQLPLAAIMVSVGRLNCHRRPLWSLWGGSGDRRPLWSLWGGSGDRMDGSMPLRAACQRSAPATMTVRNISITTLAPMRARLKRKNCAETS